MLVQKTSPLLSFQSYRANALFPCDSSTLAVHQPRITPFPHAQPPRVRPCPVVPNVAFPVFFIFALLHGERFSFYYVHAAIVLPYFIRPRWLASENKTIMHEVKHCVRSSPSRGQGLLLAKNKLHTCRFGFSHPSSHGLKWASVPGGQKYLLRRRRNQLQGLQPLLLQSCFSRVEFSRRFCTEQHHTLASRSRSEPVGSSFFIYLKIYCWLNFHQGLYETRENQWQAWSAVLSH